MKYESELIKEIVDAKGHEKSLPHYESECIESWIDEAKGAYPKLTDYCGEWLNYMVENPIGKFPYITLSDVTDATVDNVVPFAYKSAILSGSTKYRDIDTGEFLETFEEGRNLELVSVKMPVLTTTGKNLFDGKLEYGLINGSNGLPNNSNDYVRTQNFIPIKCERIAYTVINEQCGLVLYFYDKNKNFISSKTKTKVSDDTSIATGTAYLKFRTYPISDESITNNLNTQIQIEEGKVVTEYEPYQSNILTVNEEVELRGIGDVKDELNLLTGELTQRVGEIVLDGSENWVANSSKDATMLYSTFLTNLDRVPGVDNLICSRFIAKNSYNTDEESIFGSSSNKSSIYIRIRKNLLESEDANAFKTWLSQNPITIHYQRGTESIKTVDLLITNQDGNTLSKIKPIEGTMHLATSSDTLKPTFSGEIPVEATTKNLASFIKE